LAERTLKVPDRFELHSLVSKLLIARREMAAGRRKIDWSMGEHLASASLLDQGFDVRLSGQDSARGTFNQRHAVLHNQSATAHTDDVYIPLDHVGVAQGRFTVINSILSEAAVLGFEYGYSSVNRRALIVWEAQFGDFANGAQVVIDQFLAAGAVKWGQRSGLTLFLPHGQEGAGSEHASARLERYLQLSAQDNLFVVQPTTPAQFFHLLRKQALGIDRRPLVVMTPKSLLRHSQAVSSMDELAEGTFREILLDDRADQLARADVQQVILTSGKIYFDLLDYRRKHHLDDIPIIRVEQLYPFPSELVAAQFAHYPSLTSVVWCQEEPLNQGAWSFVEPLLRKVLPERAQLSYVGRVASAATAPGYQSVHAARQAEVINGAFRR
jgi:2-oxoglutarate dehydrogenase E1 component